MLLKVQFKADCSYYSHQQLWPNTRCYRSMLYNGVILPNCFAVQSCPLLCAGGVPRVWKKRFRHSPRLPFPAPPPPPKSWHPVPHLGKDVHLQRQGLKQQQPQIPQTSCATWWSHCNRLFVSPVREAEPCFLVPPHQPTEESVKVASKNTEGAPILPVFLLSKWWTVQTFQARMNYTVLEWTLKWHHQHKYSSENKNQVK